MFAIKAGISVVFFNFLVLPFSLSNKWFCPAFMD